MLNKLIQEWDVIGADIWRKYLEMEWSTEKPTEAGFYWVKFKVGSVVLKSVVKYPLGGNEENMNLAFSWIRIPEPE